MEPEVVYTVQPDVNRDHRQLFDSVAVATRPDAGPVGAAALTYAPTSSTEWTPAPVNWFVPNWFVDITGTIERKLEAFAHYETEQREFPHPRSERAIRRRPRTTGRAAAASTPSRSCSCVRSSAPARAQDRTPLARGLGPRKIPEGVRFAAAVSVAARHE